MKLKVEIISRETIKPSSATPHHLRSFKLSLVDQLMFPVCVPVLLFYSSNGNKKFENVERSDRLKKSLSETLTRFYPIGGRIKDSFTVNCDDKGVDYLEARIYGQLSEVLQCPEADVLNQFLPWDLRCIELCTDAQLAIQVNFFDCGGMVIGVCISHKIADASTLSNFIEAWASTARGADEIVCPSFDSASLFPPREVPWFMPATGSPREKVVTKRFVFDGSKIASLRAKATNSKFVEPPSRVTVVSALIWRCVMAVAQAKSWAIKPSMVNLAVNLRGRMVPPLPEHSFGNLITGAILSTAYSTENEIDQLHGLVGQLSKAIRKIDGDYVKKLQIDDGLLKFHDSLKEAHELSSKGEVEFYTITSWCKFRFYEADFGWGEPIWISSVNLLYKNMVLLFDTRCGDGVEAWVSLEEQDMAKFECEQDLLAFVCATNPMS